ncbi:MAG: cation-transporting P-type ATPase [Gammaproteobacteria bacterium]|nr:cation-transporting P-type ATPase [Gammaproteobacteria bacterium]
MTSTTPLHALSTEEVLAKQRTTLSGLSDDEAAIRLSEAGLNRLTPPPKRSPIARFLEQFHNTLIYVLLVAALVTALLAHWVDTSVIIGVVFINAIIGFIQEGKAEHALDAIRNLLSPQATVVRNGNPRTVASEELVPGDIVLLQSGDRVPADLRLLRQKNLHINEAMLTGESLPVEKSVQPLAESIVLADRHCIAYSGTFVTFGQGTGMVIATGDGTEIGHISEMMYRVQTLTTPLLRQMAMFAHWLTVSILVLAVATFLFGFFLRDYSVTQLFMAAVGLSVAAIPEGLPAIMTITLAIGVQRMARGNAIIRRLPAVETLGSVTVICSDKTGTLTCNEMTVKCLATADHFIEVGGAGYTPHGTFTIDGKLVDIAEDEELRELGRAAIFCNDALLEYKDGEWVLHGDPTEGALVVTSMKMGLDPQFERKQYPRVDEIPFESDHRFMATLHHDHAGHSFVYLKGAPEKVLELCNHEWHGGEERPLNPKYWHDQIERIANNGQRPLAIAFKATPDVQNNLTFEDVSGGLTLFGIFGITDPPRQEAIKSVRQCQEAGIRVMMITGDHASTARSIGAQLGIGDGTTVLKGVEIDRMDDAELQDYVKNIDIVARASPEHKIRLVKILQALGQVVAMTGDGVNDAPALKRADVGIAMGHKGTEVAKEAAEMVLADDNFSSITRAVKEGRTVYDNLKKSIVFILPTNGGEAFILVIAILLGLLLPITPVQILWVNMITAVTLSLSLAFEPSEETVMQRPPRQPGEPILSRFLVWRIVFVSLIMVMGTFGLFLWARGNGATIEYARTIAVNTLVMFEVFYLFNTRYIHMSVLSLKGMIGNRFIIIATVLVILFQVLFTYASPMQRLFETVSLTWDTWLHIIPVAFSVFILVELEKLFISKI